MRLRSLLETEYSDVGRGQRLERSKYQYICLWLQNEPKTRAPYLMHVARKLNACCHHQSLFGGTGCGLVTAFNRSSTTFDPDLLPISLISRSFPSVSLFASSSAFLLPLECYVADQSHGLSLQHATPRHMRTHLALKGLELIILLFSVLFNLLLGF